MQSQLKRRDGNARDRGWNIQGPVNMIDLCHALRLHRCTVGTIYAKFRLTSDYTSRKRLFENCQEQNFIKRSKDEDKIGPSFGF